MARTRASKKATPPEVAPRPSPVVREPTHALAAVPVADSEEKQKPERAKEGELRGGLAGMRCVPSCGAGAMAP